MNKIFGLIYSTISYLIGVAGLMYYLLWLGNLLPPYGLSYNAESGNVILAVIINLGLITIFGLQHSIMARKSFKKIITQILPAHLERSTYVMISGLLCLLIVFTWQPISGQLWFFNAGTTGYYVMYGIYFLGIASLLLSTFLLNHFELMGLKQIYDFIKNKKNQSPTFRDPFFYKLMRHPIYTSFLIVMFFTPDMNMSRLLLATGMTLYIFVGIYFEEKDLIAEFKDIYVSYKKRVPALIPFLKVKR